LEYSTGVYSISLSENVFHSWIGSSTLTEEISSYTIAQAQTYIRIQEEKLMNNGEMFGEEKSFVEFRRKVRAAEVLSAAMERLLLALQFTGRVSVVVQNGRVLKSGYEESYFRQRFDSYSADSEIGPKS
jgi:hypothetical protein